jgi:pimeloyl-ACP methyl ester carboxylesterase
MNKVFYSVSMLEQAIATGAKALDEAILRELGKIPITLPSALNFDRVDPQRFWRESRMLRPAPVEVVRHLSLRQHGKVQIVDLEGPSSGPGVHPGSHKLIARAHLRTDRSDAPTVVILHGYAIPVAYWEDAQCRSLSARGVNAIRLDHPLHLRRRARGTVSGQGYLGADPARTREAMRQSAEDAAAVVAWAKAELGPEVYVLGVSLGGGTACQLAAQVELSGMFAIAPFCDPAQTLTQRLPRQLKKELGIGETSYGLWGADFASAQTSMSDALAPLIARNLGPPQTKPENMTLIRPAYDAIVGPEPITQLSQEWGCELWDAPHGHISVMMQPHLMRRVYRRLLTSDPAPSEVPLAG